MIGLLFLLPCSKGASANEVKDKLVGSCLIFAIISAERKDDRFHRCFSSLPDRSIIDSDTSTALAANIVVKGVVTDFPDIERKQGSCPASL
jgi:hypothetical protein